jgi:hypothetical protein
MANSVSDPQGRKPFLPWTSEICLRWLPQIKLKEFRWPPLMMKSQASLHRTL